MVQAMGYRKVKLVGHDIGLMVAFAYAAQYPDEVESITLMDAFLPGVGDWTKVWLLRDLWHFHFYGEVPEKLVAGRERTYFEHFWNDFAADPKHSVSEGDRRLYAAAYAQPGGMRAGFEYFKNFSVLMFVQPTNCLRWTCRNSPISPMNCNDNFVIASLEFSSRWTTKLIIGSVTDCERGSCRESANC